MVCTINIVRYPKFLGFLGLLSMVVFRIPLFFNKKIKFYKLLGCGKNGTFDIHPDWRQWGLLTVSHESVEFNFITRWWNLFDCEVWQVQLQPIEGHGTWNKKECFGSLPKTSNYEGVLAVLTRATIRINKLKSFWSNVEAVANRMSGANGFITSVGIGEIPWLKSATLSIWQSKESMKAFAYQTKEHANVIVKTKKENWYSEEMFVRFKILSSSGKLNGVDPLKGIL